jgi:hypothetical protein
MYVCSGCLPFRFDYVGWFFFYEEDGRRIEKVSPELEAKIREEFRAMASEFSFENIPDPWDPGIFILKDRNISSAQYKNLDGSNNFVTLYVGFDGSFLITLIDRDDRYETEFVSRLKKEIVQRLTKIGFKKEYIRFVRKTYTVM